MAETLLSLEYAELIELTQTLERKALQLRKYVSSLGLPAVVWRRSGQICVISDELAELLGYKKEVCSVSPLCTVHSLVFNSPCRAFFFSRVLCSQVLGVWAPTSYVCSRRI